MIGLKAYNSGSYEYDTLDGINILVNRNAYLESDKTTSIGNGGTLYFGRTEGL